MIDDGRHPVIAAGHVVQGQVAARRYALLVGALAGDRPHVAGLAAEITRRRRVLVVGAIRWAALRGRFIHRLQRAADREIFVHIPVSVVLQFRGRDLARFVLAEGALDDAVGVGRVVEGRLAVNRSARHAVGDNGVVDGRQGLAVVVGEVADHRVGDVVAGAAEIRVTVEVRLHELVASLGVVVRTELVTTTPQRRHARAMVAFGNGRTSVIGHEGLELVARVFLVVRIGQLVAVVAFHAVGIAGRQAGTVGWRGASGQPAAGGVAADAQIARTVEILLGDRQGGPEDRIAPGVRHHAAAPVVGGLHGAVVTAVAVVALVR